MVVVAGSINADLVARVAHLPREGETQLASGYDVHAGGKGANQALAARRAGAEVALIGAVGRDGFADVALASLREAGVDLSRVAAVDRPTGVALVHVDARGRNTITVAPGANAALAPADVDAQALQDASTLVLQLESPLDTVVAAASLARGRNVRTILNAAPPRPLPPELLAAIDVLVVNEHEAAVVAGTPSIADPARFCAWAAGQWKLTAIMTLGAEGLAAADAAASYAVRAPRVRVVDTTAAGDALVGALAAALDRGAEVVDALADGVAAGTQACRTAGAQPSIATRERWEAVARELRAAATVESRR